MSAFLIDPRSHSAPSRRNTHEVREVGAWYHGDSSYPFIPDEGLEVSDPVSRQAGHSPPANHEILKKVSAVGQLPRLGEIRLSWNKGHPD